MIKPKPNINAVFLVFQSFQQMQLQMVRTNKVELWGQEMKKLRKEFKKKLKELGLAKHIDWTDDEKSTK